MSDIRPTAVVFDVGRVLFHWDLRTLFAKLIDDPVELEHFVGNVLTEQWHFQGDQGRPLAEMVAEFEAQHPQYTHLVWAYRDRFVETVQPPIEGTHALARRLHAAGVPLFALTNFGDEFFAQFVTTDPIFELFEDVVVSGVEKVAKPDPAIYAICEERFGHPAQGLFFIDDNPANVVAARARGWQAHVFLGPEPLEDALVEARLLT